MSSFTFTILLIAISIAMSGIVFVFFFVCLGRIEQRLVKSKSNLEKEIADREKAEEQTKASLQEKELLLREIHHRVKNNMQIVSSLLKMQARNIDDPHTIEILNDSQGRIRAMALIHETFYQPGDLSTISIRDYIKNLALNLFDTYGIDPDRIQFHSDFAGVSMDIETATPCGLIINELITNSIKYAFPDNREGFIRVSVLKDDQVGEFQLQVMDNGIGLPEDIDLEKSRTMGLQLVHSLVTNQLQGEITLVRNSGTEYHIKFRELRYKQRI